MNNPTLVICLLAILIVGYIVLKALATKYFVRLYENTGRNMITRPRQLLGFLAGTSLCLSVVFAIFEDMRIGLVMMLFPAALIACMVLANRSIGGKNIAYCTAYQLALGICFVGRFLVWLVEISFSIGGMICFGDSAKFTWHPFFFTIIRKDGGVSESKSANVVMNEDGGFAGAAATASNIEAEMNNSRIRQAQGYLENEMEQERVALYDATSCGEDGVKEQQRLNELREEYDVLEAKKHAAAQRKSS
jgi:hypothetical protein